MRAEPFGRKLCQRDFDVPLEYALTHGGNAAAACVDGRARDDEARH